MKVKFFCPLWGREGQPFSDFCRDVMDAGFDGVEMSLPQEPAERERRLKELDKSGLLFIAQHWETADSDFPAHEEAYEQRLRILAEAKPLFISSQTGKDWFSFEQNVQLILAAEQIAEETGMTILQETHRGKFSFSAHITLPFIRALTELRLTLDISHWCAVAESYLEDQTEAVDAALSRSDHIHARVGFPEGPQVSDPSAPEWEEALQHHLKWWDRVISRARKEGREYFTITTETGPIPYMPRIPYTGAPVADQWKINVAMKERLAKRYSG